MDLGTTRLIRSAELMPEIIYVITAFRCIGVGYSWLDIPAFGAGGSAVLQPGIGSVAARGRRGEGNGA